MSSEAKRKANSRYLAKQKSFTIRLSPEMHERYRQYAAKQGISLNSFFLKAAEKECSK